MNDHFSVRGLELHSYYAWDYEWIIGCLDFMKRERMNTLVLHRNDFVDLIIYPGKYFGCRKEHYRSIFERYSEIFRTLYKYTPTRRSSPYQRRAFLKRVLCEAARRGIQVYIENKELYFPEIILEFHPELVKDGHICATDPFFLEFTRVKFMEFFEEFPECAGIITSLATGESKVSIKSNRCTCERCRSTSREKWFHDVLMAMYEPIHEAGRTLIVRDFVFDSKSQKEIASVMENLPEDVVISLKNTPHDYYPTFPINRRIGDVGAHRQWIEFDAMGQYFGWGVGIADIMEDYRRRFADALEKGAEGFVIRTDWESLDGHTVFRTPNLVNLYSASALSLDVKASAAGIYSHFLECEDYFRKGISREEKDRIVEWFMDLMSRTWPITRRTVFVQDAVFSDSSLMPISYEHAFWLSEEKNSIADWVPEKAGVLSPERECVRRIVDEKREALSLAESALELVMSGNPGLREDRYQDLVDRFRIQLLYVELFSLVTRTLAYARYLKETKEERDGFYLETQKELSACLGELDEMEARLRRFFEETSFHPHTIYTLLDADRVSCLRENIATMHLV